MSYDTFICEILLQRMRRWNDSKESNNEDNCGKSVQDNKLGMTGSAENGTPYRNNAWTWPEAGSEIER